MTRDATVFTKLLQKFYNEGVAMLFTTLLLEPEELGKIRTF